MAVVALYIAAAVAVEHRPADSGNGGNADYSWHTAVEQACSFARPAMSTHYPSALVHVPFFSWYILGSTYQNINHTYEYATIDRT